ncbi:MAG: phosphoglucosamine mutase [Opitutae bacterium]|nr:phosphoglucosamine mutase [Opitutae bacterium]
MITASHNPTQDNGFKFFSALGKKLTDSEEESIEKRILIKNRKFQSHATKSLEVLDSYINYISGLFPKDLLKNKRVVVDLSNGATQHSTPIVLKNLGADVHTLSSGSGAINDGVGSEHPEIMSQKVKDLNADFGFAHDGDGDRVIFCNSTGEVIPGDKILGLLAIHEDKHNRLPNKGFVATIHSNSGLDASLKERGINLFRANVGDRKVAEMMRKECLHLGGESSGHIVASKYLPTGDGLLTALLVTRACYESKKSIHSLSKQITLWPSVEGSFTVKEKIPIEDWAELNSTFQKVKGFLGEQGRILLRYSGTETKLRLLVEAVNPEKANKAYQSIAKIIEKAL